MLLVLPALLLNYFGQGALILTHPAAIENPFYLLAPSWALLPLVFLATAGWLTYNRYLRHPVDESPVGYSIVEHRRSIVPGRSAPTAEPESFTCDGRRYCSEMHSCAEATYFLQHCPGTKMDGDGDGIPCERQWCGN